METSFAHTEQRRPDSHICTAASIASHLVRDMGPHCALAAARRAKSLATNADILVIYDLVERDIERQIIQADMQRAGRRAAA